MDQNNNATHSPFRRKKSLGERFVEWYSGFQETLVGFAGLRVYGSSLLTPKAILDQRSLALFLFMQLIIDTWAWWRAWSYGLQGFWLAITPILGLIFGMAILLFDRSIVVADISNGSKLKTHTMMAGRLAIVLCLAAVTAVPVELAVFENEISRRIESQEKVAIDEIRAGAITEKQEKLSAGSTANADEIAARAQSRTRLVEELDRQHDRLEKAHNDALALANEENLNGGSNGRGRGPGPVYQALKASADEAGERLAQFDRERLRKINAFDAATQALVGKTTAKVEREIEELRAMNPDQLAALYGGDWKQPDGFLARYDQLEQMRQEKPTVNGVVWGCRAVMVALGLLIMGIKLMSSSELRDYYSREMQLAHGQQEVLNDLAAAGPAARKQELTERLARAETQLVGIYVDMLTELLDLIFDNSSRMPSFGYLQGKAARHWRAKAMKPMKVVAEVITESDRLGFGLEVSERVQLFFKDGDPGQPIWSLSREDLEDLGWVDPDPEPDPMPEELEEEPLEEQPPPRRRPRRPLPGQERPRAAS